MSATKTAVQSLNTGTVRQMRRRRRRRRHPQHGAPLAFSQLEGASLRGPYMLAIVGHLAAGLSNKAIARRMRITDHTVKFHLKKIFSKLEVSSRRAAVAILGAQPILLYGNMLPELFRDSWRELDAIRFLKHSDVGE